MSALALELNDTRIVAMSDGGVFVDGGPGYAVLEGRNLLTGTEARERARLRPLATHTRFWQDLDTAPLPRPFPPHLRSADLVYSHLTAMTRRAPQSDEVFLAVSGAASEEQLSLLLGIAASADVVVSGIVDAAVAAAALGFPGERLVHVDLHLHRIVVTALERGNALERGRLRVDESFGLLTLLNRWAEIVAGGFLRQTRLDPLDDAASEQMLYARLPRWLQEMEARETLTVGLGAGPDGVSIELTRAEVLDAVSPRYDHIARLASSLVRQEGRTALLVSSALAELPGLLEHLAARTGANVVSLPPAAAARGLLAGRRWFRESGGGKGALRFLTRLEGRA